MRFKYFLLGLFMLNTSLCFSLDLELTQGINSALPIAIDSFGNSTKAQELKQIIEHDLNLSGQFKIITDGDSKEHAASFWKQKGADSVLRGTVSALGADKYAIKVELLDAVAQERLLFTQSFQITPSELRALAHHISDSVYEKLTGVKGIFSTHIAYVLTKNKSRVASYTLIVADVDGFNPRSLLTSSEPILSPSCSPDGKYIAYSSLENKRGHIFISSITTGKRKLVARFYGINGAPAWSPDGRELVVVLSNGENPNLYRIELSNGQMKQLTFDGGINTEPRYSPDGSHIVFTSGRGGSPQIYKLTLATGKIERLSFQGNYNAKASYTPDQNHVVMLHREDNGFNIGVQDMATGRITPVSFSSFDESPSIAPNGKFIIYATRDSQERGVLSIVSLDGRVRFQLPAMDGNMQEPSWLPF